ncbi:probable transcription factor At3g04930 [Solanum dulcamara]|uniref:probable transcription factor At3g04930 n=1 Tax=Solanum dulcamara TaxID=45834 RepID=UPI002484F273|nr:probable transcription factor At3g04930 [Solanum dulcamara]
MDSVPDRHHQTGYNDDTLDYDVDVDGDDDSNSSPSVAGEVTIAVAGVSTGDSPSPLIHTGKRPRIDDFAIPVILPGAVKKPSGAFDESRKLFQRLWTDEDEIELLRGFLEYTTQRGLNNSSQQHHYDTTAFYDQIKSKFQLDFNKNQLVEKLRRLKKKYRTVMSKMGSGKDFVFKSAHDQVTFEISHKIWSSNGGSYVRSSPGGSVGFSAPPLEDGGLDDEDHLNPNPPNSDSIVLYHSPSPKFNLNSNPNGIAIKTPRSHKRSPPVPVPVPTEAVKVEQHSYQPPGASINVPMPTTNSNPVAAAPVASVAASAPTTVAASVPSLIEETVRNCVSPIFKELLNNVANLNGSARGFGFGFGGMGMSPIPLGFGGGAMSMEMMGDEKWRKQQMLELEVYSKRLELVQDQVKAQLEELRSMGSNN